MTADRSSMHRARAACVLLALGAPRAAARDRLCNLWQVIDQDSSKFTHVSGVLNDKYSLNLKGSWHPHISGKMLQSFEGRCPSRLSQLEGRSFTLSSSSAEPIFLTYSEVKAGPATIRVSQLQAQMLPASFTISDDACEGDLEGASFCFAGQARLVALSGTAHALGHDFDLTGANGTFHIGAAAARSSARGRARARTRARGSRARARRTLSRGAAGYIEPDELRLGLQLTQVSADFAVATAEVHGPFKLAGHISSAAELPYTFDLGARAGHGARGLARRGVWAERARPRPSPPRARTRGCALPPQACDRRRRRAA